MNSIICHLFKLTKNLIEGEEDIWSTLTENLCINLLSSDIKYRKIYLNTCDNSIKEQHWKITTILPSEGRYGKEFGNKKLTNNQLVVLVVDVKIIALRKKLINTICLVNITKIEIIHKYK